MKYLKLIAAFLFIICLCCSQMLLAQSAARTITGKIISSSGEAISGASISVKGSNSSTISNDKGAFSVTVSDNKTVLVISHVSYKTKEVAVKNVSSLTIALENESNEL